MGNNIPSKNPDFMSELLGKIEDIQLLYFMFTMPCIVLVIIMPSNITGFDTNKNPVHYLCFNSLCAMSHTPIVACDCSWTRTPVFILNFNFLIASLKIDIIDLQDVCACVCACSLLVVLRTPLSDC